MDNKTIARTFRLLAQLMELHEENPFKIKSIANASFKLDKLPFKLVGKTAEEIAQVDGIGKSISAKVVELLDTGSIKELTDLLALTPQGIVEMLGIKGIGPKKIFVIWHELKIDTVGELYYACNENRLIEAKGFGLKTQEEIKKVIEFKMAANGRFLYAHVEPLVNNIFASLSVWLNQVEHDALLGVAGQFRRCCEIIDEVKLVVGTDNTIVLNNKIAEFEGLIFEQTVDDTFTAITETGLSVQLKVVNKAYFYVEWFKQTGNDAHVEEVLKRLPEGSYHNEEAIYQAAGLSYVEPELREGLGEIELALTNNLPKLITFDDLKGTLHNHSTWSDGVNTLEEMALFCKDTLNLEYLGICDHSRSAFYAKGLDEQRVYGQHQEIDALNKKLAPFKIFKGIESDILNDGSLDYSEEILKTFDFVVASIHSPLRMDEEKATARLIKAIENPYTTILGHPTGRLLLSRAGYPIDYKKVIDACAANGVVIEVNANPLRLDLDWRWHRYALAKGVMLSINPDAHRTEGFYDMHFGVLTARKGGLTSDKNLNSFSLDEITRYFDSRKFSRI
ncbi:DNA polymerase/3'-5' exonuclease PolX [Pedobacter insulae]|uniref:DNA polymerase (Family 10) n=1 Tax=Pedobacter insulae TaxID=414048 RepID=A0A1I2YJT8_9SPHI|nr:DNA polymerase/3'-5' exonuclease PolX [Pedobacter insulae]SFH25276.1 DNA polymerase (family 10) [Pedobacter insulae]